MSKEKLTDREIVILKDIANNFLTPSITTSISSRKVLIKGGMMDIAYQVCKKHEITLLNLKSKRRLKHFVIARIEFAKRCQEELNKTTTAIAIFLDKDHSLICHYKKKYAS